MAVGGIERFLERGAAFSGERQCVGPFKDHLVSGKQTGGDLHAVAADFTDRDRDADEGIFQLVVLDEHKSVRPVALQRLSRNAEHPLAFRRDKRNLRTHAGAQF